MTFFPTAYCYSVIFQSMNLYCRITNLHSFCWKTNVLRNYFYYNPFLHSHLTQNISHTFFNDIIWKISCCCYTYSYNFFFKPYFETLLVGAFLREIIRINQTVFEQRGYHRYCYHRYMLMLNINIGMQAHRIHKNVFHFPNVC